MDNIQNCTWPYWKFGLKKEDLHMKLHNQFNTFLSTIQDPQAFENDVLEISREAATQEELYRLLDQRKQDRLAELNNTLEMAALEIISNPRLISSSQWPQAVQLFRTKSLDSLVRYFATYLLDNDSGLKTASKNDTPPPSSLSWDSHLPLSPPGSVAVSDSSAPSICSDDDFDLVSRHAYSDSEPDIDLHMPSSSHVSDGLSSQTCSIDESAVAVDCGSTRADKVMGESPSCGDSTTTPQSDGSTTPTQDGDLSIIGTDDSDGPTAPQPDARPGAAITATCGGGEALARRRIRGYSPSRPLPLSRIETLSLCYPSSCDPGGAHGHPGGEASGRRTIRSRRRAQRYPGASSSDVRVTKVLSAVYRSRLRERRTLIG